jgi:hypothetical protein
VPTATYIALANTTLGSASSSVTFSSIPATYRDLVLVINATTTADSYYFYELNGDTNAGAYERIRMIGFGSGSGSSSAASNNILADTSSTTPLSDILQWNDYSATDKQKCLLVRGNLSSYAVMTTLSRWTSTNAVTSIKILAASTTFKSGSTFSLFGIVS